MSSAFVFADTSYFFSYSEIIDYYLGREVKYSLQYVLNQLEEVKVEVDCMFALFASLCREKEEGDVVIDDQGVANFINNDGLRVLLSVLERHVEKMQEKDNDGLANEMSLKIMINVVYICCDYLQRNPTHKNSSKELNQLFKDMKIDELLMKMVTLSLQAHYIPVKKLAMIYTKVLSNLFHHGANLNSTINPVSIFNSEELAKMPGDNLLKMNELEKIKAKYTSSQKYNAFEKTSPVEHFYRKHNTGDCPLAQSIVVGLLRSLLTICNCQMHKKFNTVKGGGVDSFRQWQLSYRWLLSNTDAFKFLPVFLINRLESYELFDQQPTSESELWGQFYSHKIYTTASITSFFFLLLLSFKYNEFFQYSYFLQLISDANGILVFLKFLTDKFLALDNIVQSRVYSRSERKDVDEGFKEKTMLTIYSVLLMIYASCNNYVEKTKTYLFQYNSYLIIKKIPALFMGKEGKIRVSFNKEEEGQEQGNSGNSLPSRLELEELEKERGGSGVAALKKLTELCIDLLKIQIPFFSKKMKQNTANMKLIIDLYCKYPKEVTPITLTPLQKLFLKTKCNVPKPDKLITSVEEMKAMHNDYNNQFYWGNDFVASGESAEKISLKSEINIGLEMDPEVWLQENMWKYYD